MSKQNKKKVGFLTQANEAGLTSDIPEVGVGMLGYAFMGKAHSNGYKQMPYMFWPPPAIPRLITISGRHEKRVAEAARRYGYEGYTTDWHSMIDDENVAVFDNNAVNNLHAQPCIEAVRAKKAVICEKPLARNAEEAKQMFEEAEKAGVTHCCAFNCRLVPAVRLAKDIIDSGRLGRIYHFRSQYLQEWMADPEVPLVWRKEKEVTGSGAVGDFSHIIDLARYLCGEPKRLQSMLKTFVTERPLLDNPSKLGKVEVEDAFVTSLEFENGALGFLEGSQYCVGRKNYLFFEINGEKGSILYDHEYLNYLKVYFKEEADVTSEGYRTINVTEQYHPYGERWWPQGHVISWGSTFVNQAYHFIDAVVNGTSLSPYIATFEDGYKASIIGDAILESARNGKTMDIHYW